MKRILFGVLGLLGLVTSAAQAQQAIQASPTHLDAAALIAAATAAVNTALTVTLPAPASGLSQYITNININLCQDTTASTSLQLAVTSANLGGWLTQIGQASSAGACSQFNFPYPNGLKAAVPGTAVTLTIAQPGTHGAAAGTVAYYNAL